MIWITVLLFIGMLLILVLVHEAGHLMAAKWAGCKVEEFGFGFPPRLLSRVWGETRYSLNLLPLGGFVKIEGEDMAEENPAPTSFASKSAGWRVFILSAGVIMNILLAYVLLTVQTGIGAPTLVTPSNVGTLTDRKTYILDVAPDSPAAQAELAQYDRITEIQGVSNPTIEDVQMITKNYAGQQIHIVLDRAGKQISTYILARANPPANQGALGIGLAATGLQRVPLWKVPIAGFTRTVDMFVAIFTQFGELISKLVSHQEVAGDALTGPIGIAVYTNEAAQLGPSYLLEFMALISINLAIINILPIPALDGGRILFVALEKLFGRRWLNTIESRAHFIGFVLLIGLMIFITIRDVHKYF